MRFEQMEFSRQRSFLERLYKMLNKEFFSNELPGARLDICSAHEWFEDLQHGELGIYKPWEIYCPFDKQDTISITFDLVEELSKLKRQYEQAYYITMVVLHEMVHQYYHRVKGNDIGADATHPQEWQDEAAKHRLHSIYIDGEQQDEYLDKTAAALVKFYVRIR